MNKYKLSYTQWYVVDHLNVDSDNHHHHFNTIEEALEEYKKLQAKNTSIDYPRDYFKLIEYREIPLSVENNMYCNDCGACGESGCCPVYKCDMTENCKYKDIYFKELKESYALSEKLQNVFYDKLPQELKDEFNKTVQENWEEWNKNET